MLKHSLTNSIELIGSPGEVCQPITVTGGKQEIVSLEQKVTQLYELLRVPVCRYLIGIVGNPGEAEELTQEAFLKLYLFLRDGRAVNDVRAWIFRVAHNLAVDRQKHTRHEAKLDDEAWTEIVRWLPDAGLNPEEKLLHGERARRFHSAVGQLSPQQRQCLMLRAEGFRYREIAEILNIEISSVSEFVRRAVKRLTDLCE